MFRIPALVLVFSALPAGYAQMDMNAHVMEMQDEIPPDQLPAPVRMSGIGNAHLEITAKPEAQMWFDQGLNLLHDFWDYESARAFEQAVRVDPQCAMCYWGLYRAESFYHSTTQGLAGRALAKAVALKEHASERERFLIEAAAAHNDAMHSQSPIALFARERELLKKAADANPQDLQMRILLANAGGKDSRALLESVLKEDPDNSAANHYYIHALEGTDHPEKALHSAEILGRLAPASGHMVHMPGHIFFRMGDYARAEQAFADSLAVDERYMREQHVDVDNDWNYVHNLMYAVANLLEEGKFNDATRLSAKISGARGKLESTLYINSARDSISRLDARLPVALRTADFPRILQLVDASTVPNSLPNLEFLRERLVDFASAMEAIRKGDLPQAEQKSERLDAGLWRMSQQREDAHMMHGLAPLKPATDSTPRIAVMPDALLEPLLKILSIMSLEVRGSLLAGHGKLEDAKALFVAAAKEEKALGYREPPHYIRPVGETEGAAMLGARRWADAKAAFERALMERPHSGFALYGIALSSEQAGDRDAAAKNYTDFLAAWKVADPSLPQVAHARGYLAAH